MKKLKFPYVPVALFLFVSVFVICWIPAEKGSAEKGSDPVPSFLVDPLWPKPLPNDWLIGQVAGVAVDAKNHIWIVHRPGSLGADEYFPAQEPASGVPYVPAPPVIEFDGEGNVVQAWGGPGEGYEWPQNPHGIFIDHQENVWIGGSGANDHQVLKFRPDGKFLMQIGNAGETGGSNDTNCWAVLQNSMLIPGQTKFTLPMATTTAGSSFSMPVRESISGPGELMARHRMIHPRMLTTHQSLLHRSTELPFMQCGFPQMDLFMFVTGRGTASRYFRKTGSILRK